MSHDDQVSAWERALADGSFEEAQQALEEVVALLEAGSLSLERSIACYALGMRLAERCEKMLSEAELAVSTLQAEIPETEDLNDEFDSGDDQIDGVPF